MKYFEFKYPYYALIRAENEDEAISIYTEEVVGESEENENYLPIKILHHTALGKFTSTIVETMSDEEIESDTYKLSDLMKEFRNPNNYILLIDGELV